MENQYYQNSYNNYSQPVPPHNGGELGWDDVIREESSFVMLPEGDYRFSVEKFEKARHNGSEKIPACPKALVTLRVYAQDGSSVQVTENFFLHKKMEWKLSEFFASVGMKKKDEPVRMLWTPELIGKQGVCKVIVHNYKKDGEDRQINRIDRLYPSYDQPNIVPVQQSVQNTYQQPVQQTGWSAGKF